MIEVALIMYALLVTAAFAGAAAWPRVRVVLLSLGVLGIVVPVVLLGVLLAYLSTHPLRFG